MRVLQNILINVSGNNFRFADILFNEKIEEVRFLSDDIHWEKIASVSGRDNLASRINRINYSRALEIFDGKNSILIPGAIDSHVHFDTPGFETNDTFEEASEAAAFGGVTTVIDMPCTSLPPVTNADNFRVKYEEVRNRSLIDFAFWGGVRGNDFSSAAKITEYVKQLNDLGAAAFKVYVISGMNSFADLTYEQIETAAGIIAETGKPMGVHAEDKYSVLSQREKLQSDNQNSWRDYCAARSTDAELIAVRKMIEIAGRTNCRVHIVHLSSQPALEEISAAAEAGIPVTAETCPHYLYFNRKDFENKEISNFLKTAPPVKSEEDSKALWQGLKNGRIKFLVTDHAGCIAEEGKTSENFWKVYGGIPGVEHRVPFAFSEGFLKNRLSFEQTVKIISSNISEFFNLKSKGKIQPGFDADFALLNLWKSFAVRGNEMHSKGKYTPFEGARFDALIEQTFLRGKIIMSKSSVPEAGFGFGKLIRI